MSIESLIKSQFAKVFTISDWCLFKKLAEANLQEAAKLLMADMPIEDSLKLLARNSRKRLLIGVGVELLVKAIYLKQGYMINKLPKDIKLEFPFSAHDAGDIPLVAAQTFTLNDLIEKLPNVAPLQNVDLVLKGLRIAKVFRNKEGHGVTASHTFDASNYTDIASSLAELYHDVFCENLLVRFSFAQNEQAIWQISK